MIILITGTPGSGKTLYSIGLIEQYIADGRPVYTDIDGLQIDGVLPAPDDWNDTPESSVVVYDECQKRFGSEGMRGGRSDNPYIAAMETHRHTGHDLLLITQHPNLLHAHVRRLVGRHHHVFRMYGSKNAKVFTMDRVMKTDSRAELTHADEKIWSYPKKHFKLYKSATVHTHKFKLPRYAFVALGSIAFLSLGVFVLFNKSSMFDHLRSESSEPTIITAALADQPYERPARVDSGQNVPAAEITTAMVLVGGCVATATFCRCYDPDLVPLDMTHAQCEITINNPLPRALGNVRTGARERPHGSGATGS